VKLGNLHTRSYEIFKSEQKLMMASLMRVETAHCIPTLKGKTGMVASIYTFITEHTSIYKSTNINNKIHNIPRMDTKSCHIINFTNELLRGSQNLSHLPNLCCLLPNSLSKHLTLCSFIHRSERTNLNSVSRSNHGG